jgi:hypothetical protein
LPDSGDYRLWRKGEQQSDIRSSCHFHSSLNGLNLGCHFNAEYGDCVWFYIDRDDHCDRCFRQHFDCGFQHSLYIRQFLCLANSTFKR